MSWFSFNRYEGLSISLHTDGQGNRIFVFESNGFSLSIATKHCSKIGPNSYEFVPGSVKRYLRAKIERDGAFLRIGAAGEKDDRYYFSLTPGHGLRVKLESVIASVVTQPPFPGRIIIE